MSRQPSPRLDQLRALREANFARAEQLRKEAAKEARQPEPAAPREQTPPAERPAKKPVKAAKPSEEPASGKAEGKKAAKKPAAKKASKKKGKS